MRGIHPSRGKMFQPKGMEGWKKVHKGEMLELCRLQKIQEFHGSIFEIEGLKFITILYL